MSLTCLAINTSYQSSIKEIPFFIHHGRDARLPFNDLVNKLPEINYAEEDYAAEMSLRLSQAFTHVKTMSQRSRDSAVKYYNRKVAKEAKKISIGSLVLLKNETGGSETTLSWPTRYVGPYRVSNKYNNNFEISGVFADKRIQTVHAKRVKLAILRDDVPYPFNNAIENDDTGKISQTCQRMSCLQKIVWNLRARHCTMLEVTTSLLISLKQKRAEAVIT